MSSKVNEIVIKFKCRLEKEGENIKRQMMRSRIKECISKSKLKEKTDTCT